MMEKEISETYSFNPDDFNEKGRRKATACLSETSSRNTNVIFTIGILQNTH
jgi:hypothetical protein